MAIEQYIQPIIHWIEQNPHWAGIFVFLVAFTESLLVIGTLVPGIVCMTAVGGLIGLGIVSLKSMLLFAIVGAILGDGFSFAIGYYYHDHLRERWPFCKMPDWIAKAETFFHQHGGKSIFLARFAGPLRAFVPVIGGMLRFNIWRYLLANVTSACVWAPSYLLPGYFIGLLSKTLPPKLAFKILGITLIFLFLLTLSAFLIKRIISALNHRINRQLERMQNFLSEKSPLWKYCLRDQEAPDSHRQLKILLLFIFSILFLVVLTWHVSHFGWLTRWNIPTWYLFRAFRHPSLEPFFIFFTYYGEKKILIWAWTSIFIYWIYRRDFHSALHWLALASCSIGATTILKCFTHIQRPDGLMHIREGFSYPSGHALLAVVFYGFLAMVCGQRLSEQWRSKIYAFVVVLVVGIGFSRLYLGDHWLTDIVGGAVAGYCLLLVFIFSMRLDHRNFPPPFPITFIALVSLHIAGGLFAYAHYEQDRRDVTPLQTIYRIQANTWWENNGTDIPFYRLSLTGNLAEVLNLQWFGEITQIVTSLKQQQWHVVENSLAATLTRLASKQNLPPFRQSYLDHEPVLTLYKTINQPPYKDTWLVLRLWDGNIRTENDNKALWVGTVNYSQYTDKRYLSSFKQSDFLINLGSPTEVLSKDLIDWQFKRIDMQEKWHVNHQEYGHTYFLMIKAK